MKPGQATVLIAALILGLNFLGASANAEQNDDAPDVKIPELRPDAKSSEAISLAQQALAMRESTFGPDHPEVAQPLSTLAQLYIADKRIAEAELLYKRALAIEEKAFGRDHFKTVRSLTNLAALYTNQKRGLEADPMLFRVIAIRTKVLGPNHNSIAGPLTYLAEIRHNRGHHAEAEVFYKRALMIRESAVGPEHTDVAIILSKLAALYKDQHRYSEAEVLYKRVLAIRETAFGYDHPQVANSLVYLARLYQEEARYSEAEPLRQRALAIFEKARGPDDPLVAASAAALARLYILQGRYSDAERPSRHALAIREKVLGAEHPATVASLIALAALYKSQGRYDEAETFHTRALTIREKVLGSEHPDVARSLSSLASLYQSLGRFRDAETFYRRTLAIREKVLGSEHPDVANALTGLANVYKNMGRPSDAESLYRRALAIVEKARGSDDEQVAFTLGHLARFYVEQGRYADADPLFKRALTIRENASDPDNRHVITSLHDLARLYRDRGHFAEAEALIKRAMTIVEAKRGPDHPRFASSLGQLAEVYRHQDRYPEAEAALQQAIAIQEKFLVPCQSCYTMLLDNLALVYHKQGRLVEAESLVQRVLAVKREKLHPEHPSIGSSLNNLALIYEYQGRLAEAEQVYKESLAVKDGTIGPSNRRTAITLNNLVRIYHKQDRNAEALVFIERMLAGGLELPEVALSVLFAAERQGHISAVKAQDEALLVVQRAAYSSAASALNKLSARFAAGATRLADLVRRDQDLAFEAEALDHELVVAAGYDSPNRDFEAEWRIRGRWESIMDERKGIERTFAVEFPDYLALSRPAVLSMPEMQALLSEDEALIVLDVWTSGSYIFALTRSSSQWERIPLGTAELQQKVGAFRRGLDIQKSAKAGDAKGGVLFDLEFAHQLYATLLGPVEKEIKGKTHLLIVPDGPLTALPFHLLITDKPASLPGATVVGAYRDASWMIKRQAISVLPGIANLKTLRSFGRQDRAKKPFVGFGNPIFDPERARAHAPVGKVAQQVASKFGGAITRGYDELWQGAGVGRAKLAQALPALPETAYELESVATRLGASSADLYLGEAATETTVKAARLTDYRVVYFATHGLVAGDVEGLGEPALVLTLPPQASERDDGLLTASEVAQLKLNAEWVVLSACNTAAGYEPGADALSGLARAFFYAGTRALLVSHWSVASHAAARLATSTFEHMKSGPDIGRAEALRRAVLAYMNDDSDPLNAYPAYWGPFSLVGEGEQGTEPRISR